VEEELREKGKAGVFIKRGKKTNCFGSAEKKDNTKI